VLNEGIAKIKERVLEIYSISKTILLNKSGRNRYLFCMVEAIARSVAINLGKKKADISRDSFNVNGR